MFYLDFFVKFLKVMKKSQSLTFTVLDILENGHKKCERVAASCLHSGDSRSDYNTHCSKDLPWEIAGSQQNAFLRDVDISSQQGHHFPCCNFHVCERLAWWNHRGYNVE